MISALTFGTITFNVITHNNQPWLKAPEIARALGYSNSDALSRIFRRNKAEFTSAMSETVKLSASGNLLTETRIFSLRGAHLLAMFARTPVAANFRRWVLDILDRETASPPPALSLEALADERLRLGHFILRFDPASGRPQISAISQSSCIIDPNNSGELETFIKEFIHFEQIPLVLQAAMYRVNLCYQAVKNKAAPPTPVSTAEAHLPRRSRFKSTLQ